MRLPDPGSAAAKAIEARRQQANGNAEGDHYHSIANPAKGEPVGERGLPNQGYRPGRKTASAGRTRNASGTVANHVCDRSQRANTD